MARITVKSIDHIVLTVQSTQKTVEFYTKVLGMQHEVFRSPRNPDVERHALVFGSQKINLHDAASPWEPHAKMPLPGTADLCFLTESPVDEVLETLKNQGFEILEGQKVVERVGARGRLRSCYIRDPDDNLIEISNYV